MLHEFVFASLARNTNESISTNDGIASKGSLSLTQIQKAKRTMADHEMQVPWFSGLSLPGDVATQYVSEEGSNDLRQSSHGPRDSLDLSCLAPITIFVGANNSGKSRLLRELFRNQGINRFSLKPMDLADADPIDYLQVIQQIMPGGQNNHYWRLAELFTNNSVALQECRSSYGWIDSVDLEFIANLRQHQINTISNLEEQIRMVGPTNVLRYREIEQNLSEIRKWQEDVSSRIHTSGLALRIGGWDGARRYYVPILRGMRPVASSDINKRLEGESSNPDCYLRRTAEDYFPELRSDTTSTRTTGDASEKLSIFTGLSLYKDLQRRLLSAEPELRASVVEYQEFLSNHFFSGLPVLLVPAPTNKDGTPNDVVYLRIGSQEERRIYELGDGMQTLIICTYPIVTETKKGCLFFIEEPDLSMHPSLQRTFVEFLLSQHRLRGHQFFITTHSNHVLDLVGDSSLVSILSFSAKSDDAFSASSTLTSSGYVGQAKEQPALPRFHIRCAPPRDRLLLAELGVRPSSTFLANASILIEGVSDASYLRIFMYAFLRYLSTAANKDWLVVLDQLNRYREDSHYVFVEYNGANLCHLSFIESQDQEIPGSKPHAFATDNSDAAQNRAATTNFPDLCAKAIVIADGDIYSKSKGDRANVFATQLGDRFIVLPGKEIENLIPAEAVRRQVRADHSSPNRKRTEQELIDKITYAEYAGRSRGVRSDETLISSPGLGKYLQQIGIGTYCIDGGDLAGSGTLSSYYKYRWSGNEGIPKLIRAAIESHCDAIDGPSNSGAGDGICVLPNWITSDIIWLCTCLYCHIAECNHDHEAMRKLQDFKSFMQRELSPDVCVEHAHWPILDPSESSCRIAEYLQRENGMSSAIAEPSYSNQDPS